jgi:hypothetical protein
MTIVYNLAYTLLAIQRQPTMTMIVFLKHTYSVAGPHACHGRGILPQSGSHSLLFPKMCPPSTYA